MMKTITLVRVSLPLIAAIMIISSATAQEESKFEITPSADIVSSYVWRGDYNYGASVQPALTLSYKGAWLEVWGSTEFATIADKDVAKEFDITLGYEINRFSIAVTDYWWSGEGARYGNYSKHHYFEGTLGYNFGESFPLSLAWNTMFAGGDKDENGDLYFSSYFEAAYEFDVVGITVTPSIGISPWEGMYSDEFNVASIALKASKDIKVTDSFNIPIFTEFTVSPANDNVFIVFGISF